MNTHHIHSLTHTPIDILHIHSLLQTLFSPSLIPTPICIQLTLPITITKVNLIFPNRHDLNSLSPTDTICTLSHTHTPISIIFTLPTTITKVDCIFTNRPCSTWYSLSPVEIICTLSHTPIVPPTHTPTHMKYTDRYSTRYSLSPVEFFCTLSHTLLGIIITPPDTPTDMLFTGEYGVAATNRLLKIISLFYQRDL